MMKSSSASPSSLVALALAKILGQTEPLPSQCAQSSSLAQSFDITTPRSAKCAPSEDSAAPMPFHCPRMTFMSDELCLTR
jgi:hypothetical protein